MMIKEEDRLELQKIAQSIENYNPDLASAITNITNYPIDSPVEDNADLFLRPFSSENNNLLPQVDDNMQAVQYSSPVKQYASPTETKEKHTLMFDFEVPGGLDESFVLNHLAKAIEELKDKGVDFLQFSFKKGKEK